MSDVTAQDFIDAAGKVSDPKVVAVLLAAAEQREQLNRVLNAIHPKRDGSWSILDLIRLAEAHRSDSETVDGTDATDESFGRLRLERQQQIATLTARAEQAERERDDMAAQMVVYKAAFEHAGYAPDWALMDLVGRRTHELTEAQATLARVRVLAKQFLAMLDTARAMSDPPATGATP